MAKARVYVTLKKSVFDPQGKTIHDALLGLGYAQVRDVRQGKFFELDLAPGTAGRGRASRGRGDRGKGAVQPCHRELPSGGRPMRIGVVVFPGSNCDHDAYHVVKHVMGQEGCFVWHKDSDLPGHRRGDPARRLLVRRLPAHGRGGALQPDHARGDRVRRPKGGPVLGICNGFQILQEAGLLPGAMLRNKSVKFLSQPVHIRVERDDTIATGGIPAGTVLTMPIGSRRGQFLPARSRARPPGGRGAVSSSAT